jgi:hypothetical protein
MRILRLILAGVLALSPRIVGLAGQAGSPMGPAGAGPVPRFVQIGDGNGSGWHSATGGKGGDWNRNPYHSGQWEEQWARPHWVPNHFYGFWGPPEAWGVPHIGWGVPYVPHRYDGDWGALWYPYAEWRGPHGGWGNP